MRLDLDRDELELICSWAAKVKLATQVLTTRHVEDQHALEDKLIEKLLRVSKQGKGEAPGPLGKRSLN